MIQTKKNANWFEPQSNLSPRKNNNAMNQTMLNTTRVEKTIVH